MTFRSQAAPQLLRRTQLPWGLPTWTVNKIKLISANAQISPPGSMIYQELLLTTVLQSFIRHHRVSESLGWINLTSASL